MHVVSSLANHDFLKMEEVLSQTVEDCFAYMQYSDAKVRAEHAQMKYERDMQKNHK